MSSPLVSVIIPVFNVEAYLKECLDSIINQTFSDIEIICIDDGSTDSSPEILREYASKDSRVIIITKENGGLSSARNAGMEATSGEYVTFLDSDDYLEIDAIQQLYDKASSEQLDMLVFCGKSFCEKGFTTTQKDIYSLCPTPLTKTMTGPDFLIESFKYNNHIGTSPLKLFRTKFLKENNIKFIQGILHEDEPYYYEAILAAQRVTKIPNQFYLRRFHCGSITTCEKNSKHVIGKLTAISRILELSKEKQISGATLKTTMEFISAIAYNLTSDYYSLSQAEQDKLKALPFEQQHLLQLILCLTNAERMAIIEKSFSYRLGMALTKPFRWVYELLHK